MEALLFLIATSILFCLTSYAAIGLFRNMFRIGRRTFPAAERKERFETWTIIPLLAFSLALAGSIGVDFLLEGSYWGAPILSFSYLSWTVCVFFLGMSRTHREPDWEFLSLEALHAEVVEARPFVVPAQKAAEALASFRQNYVAELRAQHRREPIADWRTPYRIDRKTISFAAMELKRVGLRAAFCDCRERYFLCALAAAGTLSLVGVTFISTRGLTQSIVIALLGLGILIVTPTAISLLSLARWRASEEAGTMIREVEVVLQTAAKVRARADASKRKRVHRTRVLRPDSADAPA